MIDQKKIDNAANAVLSFVSMLDLEPLERMFLYAHCQKIEAMGTDLLYKVEPKSDSEKTDAIDGIIEELMEKVAR